MANIIDSFLISLGFSVDPKGAAEMKKQTDSAKSQLLSLGNAVKAFATGFVVKEIAAINSSFEQNRIQIATFLNALELSPSFEQGLSDASDIIAQITKDAAKLPGEAEEYVEVFKTNAAYLKQAIPGGSASDIAAFTNRLTAVAKTVASTMDAGQIGRESGMLLATEGRAGSHNVLWQKLLPILMQVDGQAKITAQSFNALTQTKRVELLNKAFDKMQPGLDAASDSFDAMWGAAVSGVKQMVRALTPGVFAGMKAAISELTGVFINDQGKLTAFGESVATVGRDVGIFVTRMIRFAYKLGGALVDLADAEPAVKFGLIGIIGAVVGLEKVLKFGLIGAILLIAEDLYTFYEGGQSVVGLLAEQFPEAVTILQGLLWALGVAFVAVQGKAVTAAAETAAAWAIANAPIVFMIGGIAAILYGLNQIINKWAEVKATAKGWVNIAGGRLLDTISGGGEHMEDQARAKMGKDLEDIAFNRKFSGMGPQLPTAAESAANAPKYEGPQLYGTPDEKGRVWQHYEPGGNTTVNNNVKADIKVEGPDPVRNADEVDRRLQRSFRKGYAY